MVFGHAEKYAVQHIKGSLTRFWCPFLILLDRYEVPNRAGLSLFSIFSIFNPLEDWNFRRELQAHDREIHWKTVKSAGNYKIMDEKSTQGMDIPSGIASL
jgi:hypothetical protein